MSIIGTGESEITRMRLMSTTKPSEKQAKAKTLFDIALAARNAGNLEKARIYCEQIIQLLGDSDDRLMGVVHGELGYIHRKLDDPATATQYYQRAVQLLPASELASLGLFHSLAELGELERGLAEVVRFVRMRDSPAYRTLLSQGFRDDLLPGAQRLADEARACLKRYVRN